MRVGGRTIDAVCGLTVAEARAFFDDLELTEKEAVVVDRITREIRKRLSFLGDVGLDYLTLDRLSSTLSGGESQRINLATALGSALVGTLYVLDEPSVGLHPRDNERLMRILARLRDQQNTVLVVEHDADMIRAGRLRGRSRPRGRNQRRPGRLRRADGGTEPRADVADREVPARRPRDSGAGVAAQAGTGHAGGAGAGGGGAQPAESRRRDSAQHADVRHRGERLREVDAGARYPLRGDQGGRPEAGTGGSAPTTALEGAAALSDAVLVDQTPIGRTPRSNPVTYLKAFDPIRELFSQTREARAAGPVGQPLLLQRARRTLRRV